MIRKQIYITEKQEKFLKTHPQRTQSEILRRSLDEYIDKREGMKRKWNTQV